LTESTPAYLAKKFPPLGRYWPHLGSVSVPQATFLLLDQLEAFYGGAAGGGKSDALLAAALQYADVEGYAALILRKTFAQLSLPGAIMSRSKEWLLHKSDARWNEDEKRWTFPSGATLTFGHVEHFNDIYRYQGPEFQFVGWDELTQFDEKTYEYLFSRTRRVKAMQELGIPIRHRSASNPGGTGHAWVKRRFIEEKTRQPGAVFIPAKVYDNPGLDVAEYRESLAVLDETLRAQLLDGDWGVFEGAAFVITTDHAVDSFELHDSIDRFEALDYGLNGAPWALWAIDYEGNLIVVDMRYWRDKLPSDITPEIIELRKREWGLRNVCYADPSIWHRTGQKNKWGAPAMLADEFSDNGVPLEEANNDPRAGLIRLRALLKLDPEHPFPSWHPRAGQMGAPRLFIVKRTCEQLLEELMAAPLRPGDKQNAGEIIDPEWEGPNGHAVAMARYAVMSKPAASVEPEKSLREELLEPDPGLDRRTELLKQHIRNVQKKQPWRRLLAHD
jgi:terminase large subunit-like protein